MKKTKVKPSTKEGWAVHVYDSDRHLRFTLDSSHLWAFGWGIGVGILASIVWSALHSLSTNTNRLEKLEPSPKNTSGEVLRTDPNNSFPFGID